MSERDEEERRRRPARACAPWLGRRHWRRSSRERNIFFPLGWEREEEEWKTKTELGFVGPQFGWFGPNTLFMGHELQGLFSKDTITTIGMVVICLAGSLLCSCKNHYRTDWKPFSTSDLAPKNKIYKFYDSGFGGIHFGAHEKYF